MNRDSMLYTVVFTFLVCIGFVFFLALANDLTKERVAANQRYTERSAILAALGVPYEASQVDQRYEAEVQALDSKQGPIYVARVDGAPRYAQRFAGPGLWGTITVILAVDAAIERVAGLRLVSQNETPGLGGRIEEAWFLGQFSGERIGQQGIRVREGTGKGDPDPDNGELDAVTGASRTSQSMQAIVNGGIEAFRSAQKEGVLK